MNTCSKSWLLFLLAALWITNGGCDGCSQSDAEEPSTAASDEHRAHVSDKDAAPEPVDPPDLRIDVRVDSDGVLHPIVSNHDTETVHLRSTLMLQRETNGAWQTLQDRGAALRLACDAGVPECFTLVPGAELHLPAWKPKDGRCGCEPCTPLEPGRYRPMLRGCQARYRVHGAPFEIAVR